MRTYHAQKSPRSVAGLRADTDPVPRTRHIELDVFPRTAVCVSRARRLGDGIVGSEDFEGARVTCCAVGSLVRSALRDVSRGLVIV